MSEATVDKTPLQRLLEKHHGRDIREVLVDSYNRLGSMEEVADELGVSRVAVHGWMREFGIQIRTVKTAELPGAPS